MATTIAVNARYVHRKLSGVERTASEIVARLGPSARVILPTRPLGQLTGHMWEQLILPTRIQRDEILWSPAQTGPWLVRDHVITIQDASVFDHPEWFLPIYTAWTRLSWKVLARRVKAIITVSHFSHQQLAHHLQIAAEKIFVVPNGVGSPFGLQSQNSIKETREKYGLSKDYFLFVGTLEPRKNVVGVLDAWQKAGLPHLILAIAGSKGTVFADGKINQTNTDQVRFLGQISTTELPGLYAGARALIAPSFYEGFCLPLLEAMACGTPVITSNVTAMPEVAGEAAIFVNPAHPDEIATAIQRMAQDDALAEAMRIRGLQRAAQFSWDSSAQKVKQILENL